MWEILQGKAGDWMRAAQIRREEMGLHSLGEKKDYFEGWYFRLCDPRCSLAVIVGFSPQHSAAPFFIQTTDTLTNQSQWAELGWQDAVVRQSPFHLTLGSNEFSLTRVKLDLPKLKVRLRLSGLTPLPFSRYAPTIMGPFAYLKNMECVHGVISLHHRMEGVVIANGRSLPVTGVGYLEKDRGTSFPQRYLWFQSNQCGVPDSCFFLSLASIPLGPLTFNGCLLVVKLRDQLHRFATYTGCRLESLRCRQFKEGSGWAKLRFHQGGWQIRIRLECGPACSLASPHNGRMQGRIQESLSGRAHVTLLHHGVKVHESLWSQGGMELQWEKEEDQNAEYSKKGLS